MPSGADAMKSPFPLLESLKECLNRQDVLLPMLRTFPPRPYNELPSIRTFVKYLSSLSNKLFVVLTAEMGKGEGLTISSEYSTRMSELRM